MKPMNDVMHVVAKGWYRLYGGLMLVFSLAIVAAWGLCQYVPSLHARSSPYGLTPTTMVFASITVLYFVSLYWFLERRNRTMAVFTGSLLFSLLLLVGMSVATSSSGQWVYAGAWLVHIAFVGMYGIPMIMGWVMLGIVFTLLRSNFILTAILPPHLAVSGGSVVLGVFSFFFWRDRYTDRTDSKLNQLSVMLRSNQEQSAILIQSIADGVVVINTEGKITLINPAAASMTQWPTSEAIGIDVQLVVKVAREKGEEIMLEENPFSLVLNRKTRINQTVELTGREGKKQLVSLVIAPISIGESNTASKIAGAVAVLRDVSAERAEEQQRGEFISTASHEMRTPVAAIEGYLSLALNEKVSSIDSRARSYLEKAHSSTQHLGQLFQDLLTSAKAEDGRLSNHPGVVEMGSFLQQLVEDLRFGAQKKGLGAEFVIGTGETIDATSAADDSDDKTSLKMVKPLYYVYVDPDRLREVITNLFDNAVKYTDAGKVSIGLTGNNDVVQFYIRDTGNGIPAEDIPHLFQKFYRVDNSATRTIGGTGLGLFISRKIIELYHGRVWVESKLGSGSTFFINLPRLSAQKAAQLQATAAQTPTAAPAIAAATTTTTQSAQK